MDGVYDVVDDVVGAEQVGIPCLLLGRTDGTPSLTAVREIWNRSPSLRAFPIQRPAVVAVVRVLELSRDGLVGEQRRAVLDLLFRQIKGDVALRPADCVEASCGRRDAAAFSLYPMRRHAFLQTGYRRGFAPSLATRVPQNRWQCVHQPQ